MGNDPKEFYIKEAMVRLVRCCEEVSVDCGYLLFVAICRGCRKREGMHSLYWSLYHRYCLAHLSNCRLILAVLFASRNMQYFDNFMDSQIGDCALVRLSEKHIL